MNDSVSSEALVMPSSTGSRFGGLAALFATISSLTCLKSMRSIWSPQRNVGVARIGDLHLAQHLADDDLDVLVVDLHALHAVDLLHLVDQVLLELLRRRRLRAGPREPPGLR